MSGGIHLVQSNSWYIYLEGPQFADRMISSFRARARPLSCSQADADKEIVHARRLLKWLLKYSPKGVLNGLHCCTVRSHNDLREGWIRCFPNETWRTDQWTRSSH